MRYRIYVRDETHGLVTKEIEGDNPDNAIAKEKEGLVQDMLLSLGGKYPLNMTNVQLVRKEVDKLFRIVRCVPLG